MHDALPSSQRITIVSGLPRSGTSLMMQMLAAGGIPPLTDEARRADADNPRGYFEFERAKRIKADRGWLPDAQGKAVKLVHLLLLDLPLDPPQPPFHFDILFMRRDLAEVARSQSVMLARSGRPGANLAPEQLIAAYRSQIQRVLAFLAGRPRVRLLEVQYHDIVRGPAPASDRVAEFLACPDRRLEASAMARAVDPALYRNRAETASN